MGISTSGTSFMLYTTTPWYLGVFSVIRPRPALATWFPYKNDCSVFGLTQTCVTEHKQGAARHRQRLKSTFGSTKGAHGALLQSVKQHNS